MIASARNYLIVTASYWGFTLVDGALRMLVLFHFFGWAIRPLRWRSFSCFMKRQGSGPIWLAVILLRASAFRACSRSVKRCRSQGCHAFAARSGLEWPASVAWVVIAQGIAGVAKDLTKTASKSAIKATSAEGSGTVVPMGRVVYRLEERDEGHRLLLRRAAA